MRLSGVYVPLITPFDAAGAVALDALESLAGAALDAGARGLVALGTTAEPGALTAAEQQAVLDVVGRVCRERGGQLLVGANTPQALAALAPLDDRDLSAGAGRPERPAVTAALSLVPPFVRPGEAGVLAYFTELAAISPVPLVVYHVPYRTGQQLSATTLSRLGRLPNVAGVKHAVGGIDADTVDLLADLPAGFSVLCGEDRFLSAMLALGASGGILASAHVATAQFVALVDAWQAGDVDRARALGHQLASLSAALFAEPNPTVIKAVLHAHGRIPTASVRLPLLPASPDAARAALRVADAVAGVLA